MRLKQNFLLWLLCCGTQCVLGQSISAPVPQPGIVSGLVTDGDGAVIPGALISSDTGSDSAPRTTTATADGSFVLESLPSAVPLHLKVRAEGFEAWVSPEITLLPGQREAMPPIVLRIASVSTSVTAVFADQLAIKQVKIEETQRLFGVLPNFYAFYGGTFVPLSPKLKFKLAALTATDAATLVVSVVLAGINQAADTPAYQEGLKGYGQRFGAVYAFNSSQIFIGGALLPVVFRQDPRYFYQGTGTTTSRALHAISAPFIARGDNNHREFNFSSIGGDISAASLADLYRPASSQGGTKFVSDLLTLTGAHMVHALAEEFLFNPKNQ